MDRLSGGEPGIHFEAPEASESLEPGNDQKFEKKVSYQERSASATPVQALPQWQMPGVSTTQVMAQPSNDPALDQPQTQQPLNQSPSANLQASDGDVIEKEWVDRAKFVIAKTRNDPFSQKIAFGQMKADYLQKRFKKEIKTDDTVVA